MTDHTDGSGVTEMVSFTCKAGQGDTFSQRLTEAVKILVEDKGCKEVAVYRCVESPDRFVLSIGWTSIDAHQEWNRSVARPRFSQLIKPLFETTPPFAHFTLISRLVPS